MDSIAAPLYVKTFTQAHHTVIAPRQRSLRDHRCIKGLDPVTTGLLPLYLRHTSASLLTQENEDMDVLHDLEHFFAWQAPEDIGLYRHIAEGADDTPAHIKSALRQTHSAAGFTCDIPTSS